MTEELEKTRNSKPWQWPGEWMKDEKFWKDVTARAASGIIVLFVGYWGAVILGYIQQPNALKSAFESTFLVALALTSVVVVNKHMNSNLGQRLALRMNKWLARVASFAILMVINVFAAVIVYMALRLVFTAIKTVMGIDQDF